MGNFVNEEQNAFQKHCSILQKDMAAAIFKSAGDAIGALKSDLHVQYMVNGAKLQMQGILSQSDTLAGLVGKISGILKCVEGSFTAEALAYLEQNLKTENGSKLIETVRKLEKELGDNKTQLDTAKAKKIVESLDDLLTNPNQLAGVSGEELYNYLIEKGYDVKPLNRGNLKGIPFKEGGGFKINWGGDRILQYHPENRSHHTSAYYKVSSGETGTIRINLEGTIID